MKKRQLLWSLLVTTIAFTQSIAQPVLIKETNTESSKGSIDQIVAISPYFLPLKNGKMFFSASNYFTAENYPYFSDGTAAGTVKLSTKIITNQNSSAHLQVYDANKGLVYFVGKDNFGNNKEVYVTDGTTVGTKMLKDIAVGNFDSDPANFMMLGNKFLFTVTYVNTPGLWTSDGTEAGTTRISNEIYPIPNSICLYKGKAYFIAKEGDPNNGLSEIYETDGTSAGTKKIFSVTSSFSQPTYIVAGVKGLYVNIGTYPGTMNYFNLSTKTMTELHSYKEKAFVYSTKSKDYLFVQNNADPKSLNELRETDGTVAGTKTITSLALLDFQIVAAESYIAFTAKGANGTELWVTDGTAKGTIELDLNKGTESSNPTDLTRIGNQIYFAAQYKTATTDYGVEPMFTDGTVAGTKLIADMAKGAANSDPRHFAKITFQNVDHLVFSCIETSTKGREAYKLPTTFISGTEEGLIISENLFAVQPNPTTSSFITVTTQDNTNGIATICNTQGTVIKKINITTQNQQIDLSNCTSGVYFLQLISEDKRVKTVKFIVQ
jgi:ELWxxDGT repeat protein